MSELAFPGKALLDGDRREWPDRPRVSPGGEQALPGETVGSGRFVKSRIRVYVGTRCRARIAGKPVLGVKSG